MTAGTLPEYIENLPNFCGSEQPVADAIADRRPIYLPESDIDLERLRSAFGIALHRPWVRGYEHVLGPMERVSALFAEKTQGVSTSENRYRTALFHLLITQTSCYRYWGTGRWTDYARELCRRPTGILTSEF